MAPTIVIRDAVVTDAARLVELLVHGALYPKEDASDLAPYEAAIAEWAADPHGAILVAELTDVGGPAGVVGVCQLITFRHLQERGRRCAEIESMHVHPDHRSSGIGSVLLGAAIERARQLGCYRVQLTSNKDRPDAHRFYERHGFERSHEGFKLRLDR